jgi:hypothetical protein
LTRGISDDAAQRTAPHDVHGRIGVDVVTDSSQRLLECPRFAALPLQLVALQLSPEHRARAVVEKVPASDDPLSGAPSRLYAMFPLNVRRSLHVLSAAGVLLTVALGPVAVSGASSVPTAASVIKTTKAALAQQSGVHIVVSETVGKTKTTVVVDIGTTTGTESITSGQKYVSITVTPKFAYVQGTSSGLSGIMGLTATQVKLVGTKSIAMAAGSTPYKRFKTSLTTAALLTFLPVAKGTTLLPVVAGSGSYKLRWSVKASASSAKVTSVLTIASNKSALPQSETVKSSTGGGATTFSHWGESVHLTVPNSSNVVSYKKVFG